MKKEEIINELEKLRCAAEQTDKEESVEALDKAIEVVEEIDNLKCEVVYNTKRAVEAEMLLREVQPYCPVLAKNQISDFFKRDKTNIDMSDEVIFHEYSEAGRKI